MRHLPLLLWLSTASAFAEPVMTWHSAPVLPGQTVVLLGGGWSATPRVELAALPDDATSPPPANQAFRPVELLQADDAGVQFVLPGADTRLRLFACRIDGQLVGLINRPVIRWAQVLRVGSHLPGERPVESLALHGPGLGLAGDRLRLRLDGREVTLKRLAGEPEARHAVRRELPPGTLTPGEHRLQAHLGGGAAGWSEPITFTVPPPPPRLATFSVLDHGAAGDGARDDTAAVQAAIAAAQAAGGGMVLFPPGRYHLTAMLELPPGVGLTGVSRERCALLWPDTETPPEAWIKGTRDFWVENLSLYCSNHNHIIAGAVRADNGWGDVNIHNVLIRGNPYRGHLKPEQIDERFRASLKLSTGGGDTVRAGGPNVTITGCDLYGGGRSLFLSGPRNGLVADCTLRNGRWGWYCLSGCDGLVFVNNKIHGADLMSTGGGINCLYGYPRSQNVYMGRNSFQDMPGWDREAMTSDAGGGAYLGAIAKAEGTTLTFAGPLDLGRRKDLAQMAVFVLNGAGRGQYREIVANTADSVTVDRPWDVPLNDTSLVSVTMLQRHYFFEDCSFADAGIGIQFYGTAVEHIVDGCSTDRSGGIHAQARNYHGTQPNFGIQLLNCRIGEGNSYRFGANNTTLSGPSHIAIEAHADARTIGGVIRGCRLARDAVVEVRGGGGEAPKIEHVVVEQNTVENSDFGIVVDRATQRVTVRSNTFANVGREVLHLNELLAEWQAAKAKLLAEPGPLVRWSFDRPLGRSVADETGRKLVVDAVADASFAEGVTGLALRPGESGYFQVGSPGTFEADLFCLPELTVSCWIRPDTIKGRYGLISKRASNTSAPFILSLRDGQFGVEATDTDGKWSYNHQVGNAIVAEQWQQVAAVFVSGQGVTLYRNGVKIGEKAVTGTIVRTAEPLRFGWDAWGGPTGTTGQPAHFPGLIDEVVIWGRALTAAEILAEYERVRPR